MNRKGECRTCVTYEVILIQSVDENEKGITLLRRSTLIDDLQRRIHVHVILDENAYDVIANGRMEVMKL